MGVIDKALEAAELLKKSSAGFTKIANTTDQMEQTAKKVVDDIYAVTK